MVSCNSLFARSVSCPLLSKNRVFVIVSTSEVVSTPSKSLNLNQFKKHVEIFDCLSSGVSNYLTHVRYNIPFMQITICVVLVCVYCSDFLCSMYALRLSKFISYVSFRLSQSKKYQTFRLSSIGSIIILKKLKFDDVRLLNSVNLIEFDTSRSRTFTTPRTVDKRWHSVTILVFK